MSVSGFGGTDPAGNLPSQDFELNLAPIIDAFTVLIAFVMISTAFASIGILDAGVAAGGDRALTQNPPPVRVAVEVKRDDHFLIQVTGKENRSLEAGDESSLKQQLDAIKKKWPAVNGIVVSADNAIPYEEVVRTMDLVRGSFPAVMLGGL